jgi:hypothetical protein
MRAYCQGRFDSARGLRSLESMRFRAWFATAAAVLAAALAARGSEPAPLPGDAEIEKVVSAISIERIQRSIFVLASFRTRHTLSDPLPSGDGIGGAGAWVRAELERTAAATGGRLRVDLDTFEQPARPPLIPQSVEITNLVATLPGSTARTYVICAHYDSRTKDLLDAQNPAPGADDNASGVAAVLELARSLSPYDFGATIVFLITAGGEQGGVGAAHWAEQAKQRGLDLAGVFDLDVIGRSHSADGRIDRRDVNLFAQGAPATGERSAELSALIAAGGENDTPARSLARAIRDAAARYVPLMNVQIVFRADRYQGDGDHAPFLNRGFAAVRFAETADDPAPRDDVVDLVDFEYVTAVARVNGAALAALARAPAPPRQVRVAPAASGNGAVLRWVPAGKTATAGYRVVWRETTAPFWEHSIELIASSNAPAQASVQGVALDDTIFGVEAVDGAGHASPAAFALPAPAL